MRRAAFVSVEANSNVLAVLDALACQLLPEKYSAATFKTLEKAILPIERALVEQATLLVESGDTAKEGLRRGNLADTLRKSDRFDDAQPRLGVLSDPPSLITGWWPGASPCQAILAKA
jgi:hypothetical protein